MYIIIEIQTNDQGETAYLTDKKSSIGAAYQKYHTVLAAAAVSGLAVHAAIILNERGEIIARDCFVHGEAQQEA